MKNINRFKAISFFLIVSYLLSACSGAAVPENSGGGGKPLLRPVVYTGIVESIVGDQWKIDGMTVTVAAAIVRDGPFNVGDQVKVEGIVNEDGSLTVSRVEAASPDDLSTLPKLGDENDSNSNDANSNDDNSNIANSNDANGNDINSNDASLNDNDNNVTNANSNVANSNDDDGNTANSNDDNGNDSNSNDDNSNEDSGDDDNNNSDSNSNDDDGNDDNSND